MSSPQIEAKLYAQKMLRRGDSWAAVSRYLSRQHLDSGQYSQLMAELREEVKQGVVESPPEQPGPWLNLSLVIMLLLTMGGIGIAILIWRRGFVSTVPLIMIGGAWLQYFHQQGKKSSGNL